MGQDFKMKVYSPGGQLQKDYLSFKASKGTDRNNWFTSADNQDQKIFIGTKKAYVTKNQLALLKSLEKEGYTLKGANGARITLSGGPGVESIHKIGKVAKAVGEAGERVIVGGANRKHDAIEKNFKDSGAFTNKRPR